MYKRLFLLTSTIIIIVTAFFACKREIDKETRQPDLIADAKIFFDLKVATSKTKGKVESNAFSFDLQTDWNQATIERIQSFDVVVTPLKFKQSISYSRDGGKTIHPLLLKPFLATFKDKNGQMTAEIVYKTGNSTKNGFDGNILVTDWSGSIKYSYVYNNGNIRKTTVSISHQQKTVKTEGYNCTSYDIYQDVYSNGELIGTSYLYTETECTDDGGSGEGSNNGGIGSGGIGPDYGGGGNPGAT